MVTFEIVSAQEVTVNGIGLLRADEPKTLTDVELSVFEAEHGYPITKANFPTFVTVTAVTSGDNNDGGEV